MGVPAAKRVGRERLGVRRLAMKSRGQWLTARCLVSMMLVLVAVPAAAAS